MNLFVSIGILQILLYSYKQVTDIYVFTQNKKKVLIKCYMYVCRKKYFCSLTVANIV